MYTANDLAEVVSKLPESDLDFANSLISQAKRRGLSPKQEYFLDKLVKKAKGEGPKKVEIGNLADTIALFDRAREHLKNPKVTITVDGEPVKISVAGLNARVPGSLNVAEPAPFGTGRWYGRITRDGMFHPGKDAGVLPGLPGALQRFAAEPAKVAAEHGKLTGNCSFCGRGLEDERSTAVGYGPVCAKRFGLPWG